MALVAKGGGIVEARQRNILEQWPDMDDDEKTTDFKWWKCRACCMAPARIKKDKDVSSAFASHIVHMHDEVEDWIDGRAVYSNTSLSLAMQLYPEKTLKLRQTQAAKDIVKKEREEAKEAAKAAAAATPAAEPVTTAVVAAASAVAAVAATVAELEQASGVYTEIVAEYLYPKFKGKVRRRRDPHARALPAAPVCAVSDVCVLPAAGPRHAPRRPHEVGQGALRAVRRRGRRRGGARRRADAGAPREAEALRGRGARARAAAGWHARGRARARVRALVGEGGCEVPLAPVRVGVRACGRTSKTGVTVM